MEGFAAQFASPEQYILDITYEIWEKRGIGLIRNWYAADCPVSTPHGVTHSVDDVIHHTLDTMVEFPDRQIYAEDVIIGEKERGFYSSHRARSIAVHRGDGFYGPATGRTMRRLAVADCLCRENRIVREWLLADQAIVALQLGLDPVQFGIELGRAAPDQYALDNDGMVARWSGEGESSLNAPGEIGQFVIDGYDSLWNDQNLQVLHSTYDRAMRLEGPQGFVSYGRPEAARFYTSLLASIPDGRFEPHHLIVKEEAGRPVRVALRWSFAGHHAGQGRFGLPSGCPLTLLAISHFEVWNGRIQREWLVIDESAVYAQIGAYGVDRTL